MVSAGQARDEEDQVDQVGRQEDPVEDPAGGWSSDPGEAPPPQAAETGARGTIAAVAAFLVTVPFALLAMLVTSESERIERLDRGVADALHDLVRDDAGMTTLLTWISRISDPWWLRAGALLLAIAMVRGGRRRAAVWLVVTVGLAGLVGLGLKLVVQRARPAFDEPVYVATGYSFPSGHALNSMAIGTAVVVALWPVLGRAGRIVAVTVATAGILVVGLDRVALGVHFLTDVLAGWAVGLAVVAATTAAFVTPDDVVAVRRSSRHRPLTWPRAIGGMVARLLAGWLAILTVMVALGLLVTGALADRWPLTAEDEISTSLEQGRTPTLDSLTLVFRHVADTPVIIITMLVVAVILRLSIGRWREGLFVVAATTGQALVFVATTAFVDRSRPDVEKLDDSPPTSSFPSGHTSAALALYLAIATVLIRTIQRPWLRRLLAALCLVPPLLVAYARLYRGMHHPSDVVGSLVNASACLWLAARVVLTGPLPEDAGQLPAGEHSNRSTVMSGARP